MARGSNDLSSAPVGGSIWERTRRAATQEILDTALRLFTEQGYDETPISQIAGEAGVSERTLFRYFGAKQDLLGEDQARFGEAMRAAIDEQPADAGVWDVLRAGIAAALSVDDDRERALQRFRLLHSTASLRAGWLDKRLRYQEDILPLIADRAPGRSDPGDPGLRAIVATAFACLDAASVAWVQADGAGDPMTLYDACLAAVRA